MSLGKVLLGATVAACLCAAVVIYEYARDPSAPVAAPPEDGAATDARAVTAVGPDADTVADARVGTPATQVELADMPPLRHQQETWRRTRGYFTPSDYAGYATYDSATLRELSRNGDLIALNLVANELFAAGEDEKGEIALHLAAMYGSSAALTRLSGRYQHRLWELGADQVAERQQALGQMLVYAEVAARRGDFDGVIAAVQELAGTGIQFTSEELGAITSAADSIYEDLSRKRAQIGMPEFDNEVPPLEVATKSFMLAAFPTDNAWASSMSSRLPRPQAVDLDS